MHSYRVRVQGVIIKKRKNSPSQASAIREPWTPWCSSWFYKRQRNQRSNFQHPLDHRKSKRVQKNIHFYFFDYVKAFDYVDHNKLWKILKEIWIPDHLTCLLRNLHAGQKAIVRTGHGTTDWFQIAKGVCQGCILSPCLFNLYAEYILQNVRLDEAQAGIKTAKRNINNLRYTDDTTLMAESEEELKSSWWKWKRRVKKFA